MQGCKNYEASSGNEYPDYFPIDALKDGQQDDDEIKLNMFVLASKDTRILLSPTNRIENSDEGYEIGWFDIYVNHV